MGKAQGFPRRVVLRNRREVERVFAQGRFVRLGSLSAKVRRTPLEHSRFLIAARRSAGSAPQRNLLKRRVREALRHHRASLLQSYDVCLFLSKQTRGIPPWETVEAEIRALFALLQARP